MSCVFSVGIPPAKLKKVSQSSRKTFYVSKNELESSWMATISLWRILLLVRGNLELVMPPLNPCYHHIDSAYDSSMYYQLSNPFCLCPGQQAQHVVPVQQGYIKLQPTTENITQPQMDTTMRTLRLETSKRGRPNAPCCPSSAGSSQRDLDAPFPKNWASHLLRGECQVVRIGKRSP